MSSKHVLNFLRRNKLFIKINTIVALGKIAFDACLNFYMQDYDIKRKDFVFQHGTNIICQTKKFSLVATILVQEM